MSETGWLGMLAWVLQPGAAAYALRLSRLFGTRRVGWFVCSAFLALAFLHIIHSLGPRGSGVGAVDILISVLLLVGLAHIETVFSGQLRLEGTERQLRSELRAMTSRNLDLEETNRTLVEHNTRRERKEEELKESARQFRSLFLDHPHPMWVFDLRSLRFLEVNKAALREYGFSEAEFMGLSVRDLHPPEDVAAFSKEVARPKSAEGVASAWRHYHKDGTLVDVEITACDLFYAQRPARLVVAQNVTRQKLNQDSQRREEKLEAMSQMAAECAQHFGGLLTAVDEQTALLLKKNSSNEIGGELRQIASATSRAAAMSRQLLTLGGRQPVSFECLDLEAAIKEWMAIVQPVLNKQVKTRLALASNLPPICGNSVALQQVFVNLVMNAREAMPGGGTLMVCTTAVKVENATSACPSGASGHFACLSVSDTGTGMTPEVQENLFKPYFTTRTQRNATGLGLATARALIKQHSGWIDFRSEQDGGSEFRVFLPLPA